MGAQLLSAMRVFLAEGQYLGPDGRQAEDQGALITLVNDVMTSWWAQAVAIVLYAGVVALLYSSLRREGTEGQTVSRRRATVVSLGVFVALAALVVVAAALRPGPLVIVEFLILFAVLVYLIVRSRAPVVLGVGAAIMWVVSPRRRREMREEAAARPAAQERGAALERVLDEAEAGLHGVRPAAAPRGISAPPWG
jgi:hypothetical protein